MSGLSWRVGGERSGFILAADGSELAHYDWGHTNHPYFDQLRPLGHRGVLTNHAPHDHRWHHGLWWSWKFINDVLFWEDHPEYGGNRAGLGRSVVTDHATRQSDGVVGIHQRIEWRVDATGAVLLHEERSIVASIDSTDETRWILDWDQTWTAAEAVRLEATPWPVTSWGGYAGLNYRPARSMSAHEQLLGDGVSGAEALHGSRSPWAAYGGLVDGAETDEPDRPATGSIALLQHQANLRYPQPIYAFSAVDGFGFLATAPLMHEPFELDAAAPLRLRNRVLVAGREPDADELASAQRAYSSAGEPALSH
jgi:hypothetical protein